jgi:hypothetical protein
MFNVVPSEKYQHTVEGTWGQFQTPAGRVAYILTKARLGTTGTDHERRLTAHLRPVREVLEIKGLDFNQLLQRDLDDHRVATYLIPYLLKPKNTGPAFFPPIMAVLLPFAAKRPIDDFPPPGSPSAIEVEGMHFRETRCLNAYRVLQLARPDGQLHPIKLGRMEWNDEHAKLVVLDGQHRAMALLAIDRTLNKSWSQEGAGRYSHFYEARVKRLLEEAKRDGVDLSLDHIEVPVTVCWFPDRNGPGGNPQRAARKLFVDVNKEARTPSEARLTLLSDSELLNILTRALLNRLRQDSPPLPLYAIEYDNPDRDSARPVKWSVVTNLNFLKAAVELSVFGPKKYIRDVMTRFGGRKSEPDKDDYMREQLDLVTLFTERVDDGEQVIERAHIGNRLFPVRQIDAITERFMSTWGRAVLAVVGGLKPYQAHGAALTKLYEDWVVDDAIASLAREAMFEGVGMYWTLRSSNEHWQTQRDQAKRLNKPESPKPEIVKAWEIIKSGGSNESGGSKEREFNAHRAFYYLGSAAEKQVVAATALFDVVNTNACQLGAVMAIATLAWKMQTAPKDVGAFAEAVVSAWNAALASTAKSGRDRRLVFSKQIDSPINRIRKLDSPLAVYFRYFWFELLRVEAAKKELAGFVDPAVVESLAAETRELYLFHYLVPEQEKALERTNMRAKRIPEEARKTESAALKKALSAWFELPGEAFDVWYQSASEAPEEPQVGGSEEGASEPEHGAAEEESLEELLEKLPEGE